MALFDDLSKKVGSAAQSISKKSGELVEAAKLNASIGSAQNKINEIYGEIGKAVFEQFKEGAELDPRISSLCDGIVGYLDEIEDLKEKLAEVKKTQ